MKESKPQKGKRAQSQVKTWQPSASSFENTMPAILGNYNIELPQKGRWGLADLAITQLNIQITFSIRERSLP